jgi:hypothetical protein
MPQLSFTKLARTSYGFRLVANLRKQSTDGDSHHLWKAESGTNA